jgi:hypothetical protein
MLTLGLDAWPGPPRRYQRDVLEDFNMFKVYLLDVLNNNLGRFVTTDQRQKHVHPYLPYSNNTWKHRCFFIADNGRIGLASKSSKPVDKIYILLSANTSFVLRHVKGVDSFTLIREAYVDGVMYGEALEERDEANDRVFIID